MLYVLLYIYALMVVAALQVTVSTCAALPVVASCVVLQVGESRVIVGVPQSQSWNPGWERGGFFNWTLEGIDERLESRFSL